MKKITAIICVIFAFVMVMALPVGASAPYQTYTYSINGLALYSPDAYTPAKSVDSAYMGLDVAISNPSDIEVDDEMNVYIADTDNNRIVVLDRYYKLKFIISNFVNDQGVPDNLSAPQGVFITSDKVVGTEKVEGKIYVCDTNANRILTFDRDGNFLSVIPQPESELFDEGAVYKPVAVAVDPYDRLYVVSSTTYQGIIVMTDTGAFTGFIGAQKVTISAWDQIWRRFQTDEQRALSQSYVSTEFNNVTISGDFIYVTTSSIDDSKVQSSLKSKSGDYAPVKMLNAAGEEIMRRNGFFAPSGEIDITKTKVSDTISGVSVIVDAAVGPEKTWSIIDQKRSKVFTYDFDGNLLFAFGDTGRQLGNISSKGLAGVVYQGDNMLLLDKTAKSFTVYERTEYGDILINALKNQNERRYDKAIDDWMEILKRNSNFDTAYIGIGNALYRSNQLEEALEYYEAAYDTSNYSVAYKDLRKEWLSKFILLIPVFVIVVCFACSKFLKYAKKVNKRVATSGEKKTYGQELIYVFHLIFHPFDGFWDLKHEKRGSFRAAITILGMTIVAFYYQAIGQGYLLNPQGAYSSLFAVILSVCAPLALWVIANWCLTTLFDGEGSFKDIFIATCYSLMPMVLILIPCTIASNFLVTEELDILSVITTFAFIWTGILIFFGMMITHDYSMGKNVLTSLGTILGMVCIMFIALLFSTLLGKLVSFVTNIVTELQFRM
ncbi:MAG: YIP1 family protein [Clostridia bacterium]|nr:YIP1 family protein [Clostridia bacterium]